MPVDGDTAGRPRRAKRLEVIRARQRGALSGWVEPLDLLHGLTVENHHALLDSIAISFDPQPIGGGWRWQMRAGARASVFRGLVDPNDAVFAADLGAAVADAGTVPTDLAGEQLRAIIAAGGHVDPAGLAAGPGEAAIDRRARLEALLPGAGLGRDRRGAEGVLRPSRYRRRATPSVASSPRRSARATACGCWRRDSTATSASSPGSAPSPSRRLTIPASRSCRSKVSAAPASLPCSLPWSAPSSGATIRAAPVPIVVQADFDRLIFRNGGELELSFEVARQIGVQVPEVDRPLRGPRRRKARPARVVERGDEAGERGAGIADPDRRFVRL
jgi:hypothetical protein